MKINLSNKKALVGGSSKGLGYAVAKQLASCGATVTMVSRDESLLKKNIIELKKLTGNDHNYILVDYNNTKKYKEIIDDFFKLAIEKKIAIIARGPLASGLLGGEFNKQTKFAENDHRNYNINGEAFDIGDTFSGVNFLKGLKTVEDILKEGN